jgi:cold shock CspA family protein
MAPRLDVAFVNLRRSEWIEGEVRSRAARLAAFYGRITACHVRIGAPHRHHEQGNRYSVRIELSVPGRRIVVSHEPTLRATLQDLDEGRMRKTADTRAVDKHVLVAVREAFDIARRRLQDHARRRRGAVKIHTVPPSGRIIRLIPERQHGWIQADDGQEVYFHRNAVLGTRFDRLRVGAAVRFVEERGEKGVQASTVRLSGR